MTSLLQGEMAASFTTKVSSVLNKDSRTYGKQFLFDGAEDTCWNSDEGSRQSVLITFDSDVTISQIKLQFQGGFACFQCTLLSGDEEGKFHNVQNLYPADVNKLQTFSLDKSISGKIFKLVFDQPTDTYGRIIIYNLDFLT